ncbi:Tat (twin-arginine translocation) pathway signal sequence [Halopelagius inordinatus]|uniref:Tat (Twin-arginine translocation) pathway signal sequence n=1 Tax=Halopelagius inordinatus TaxID=553467 RepID=A0A1I2NNI8_9EURY|nr:plastocyanin/azurin family copper-binding protein [Halopelagius inordinatus]SFG04590.1 Tat (twin-arginine translocation) pathway signal sequence [Halopelagius inordinatus]
MNGSQGSVPSRREFLVGAGAVGASALAGCSGVSGSNSSGSDDYDVGMTAVAFTTPELTVSVGDEVVWRNTSSRGHTVTAYEDSIPEEAEFFASGGFDSEGEARDAFGNGLGGIIDSGSSYSHTFEVPGTYEYVCIPHEQSGMVGTVVVEE